MYYKLLGYAHLEVSPSEQSATYFQVNIHRIAWLEV